MNASLLLQDKVLVVVGGTAGIGFSAAQAFVESGARVVIVGRREESLKSAVESLGPSVRGLAGDAADSGTAPSAIAMALEAFGGFDGLYHVAGGSGRRFGDGPLHEVSDEGWDATLHLNLTSLMYSNRAAVRQFLERKQGGSLLNMSSVLGSSPSPRHFATHAYAAAKAAVGGFSRSLAASYASYGIRVNVLAPALVATPMARRAAGDQEILDFIKTKQPLDGGRIGLPEDLDAAAVFFMGDASRFVTGQTLAIDGGWSVSEGQY